MVEKAMRKNPCSSNKVVESGSKLQIAAASVKPAKRRSVKRMIFDDILSFFRGCASSSSSSNANKRTDWS
ncbi:hypothetical protein M0R45_011420 [Rubus argutus]|uniref:Uncharacterized protein n=1 Tax=Rubus argutus TaxID=59490 RepID=A0AAW1YCU3_RUBAR